MIYLSQYNCITELLNLKEKNIFFEKNFLKKEVVNGVLSNIIQGTLTYKPEYCEHCGTHSSNIIKYGFKTSFITLLKVVEYNTYLSLKKQKFLCKCCNKTFLASTNIVKKHCFISNNTKLAVANELKENMSEKSIAKRFNVSHNTVSRIISSFYSEYTPKKGALPKVLCFDEFKSVKNTSGSMSFIFMDGESHKIIDILEDRRLHKLKEYFSRYELDVRKGVKHIVIDMYSPYISLIKSLFPCAEISIDRFHLVQLINRSFNKTRIGLMKKHLKTNRPFYNKLKNYWKLLLKDGSKLSTYREHYHRCFKKNISESEIIDYLVGKDADLSRAYDIYQNITYAIRNKDYSLFKKHLQDSLKLADGYILTSLKTFKEYLPFIDNSLKYTYSNGPLEGFNNKVKLIKRIAFGFRSFVNLRNRVLIASNLLNLKMVD